MKAEDQICSMADVPLEIAVELDQCIMSLRELLELDAGSIIAIAPVGRREHRHTHGRRCRGLRRNRDHREHNGPQNHRIQQRQMRL